MIIAWSYVLSFSTKFSILDPLKNYYFQESIPVLDNVLVSGHNFDQSTFLIFSLGRWQWIPWYFYLSRLKEGYFASSPWWDVMLAAEMQCMFPKMKRTHALKPSQFSAMEGVIVINFCGCRLFSPNFQSIMLNCFLSPCNRTKINFVSICQIFDIMMSKILAILCIWKVTSRPLIWRPFEPNFVYMKKTYGIFKFFSIFFNFLL